MCDYGPKKTETQVRLYETISFCIQYCTILFIKLKTVVLCVQFLAYCWFGRTTVGMLCLICTNLWSV